MAEILLLPVQPHRAEQFDRLCADLAIAYESGQDLGSRIPHIQAASERLLELSRLLKDASDNLDRSLVDLGLQDKAAHEPLRCLTDAVQGLAENAQLFVLCTCRHHRSHAGVASVLSRLDIGRGGPALRRPVHGRRRD